jgi:hypothetical protein
MMIREDIMKKRIFLLALVLTGIALSLHAQYDFFDLLNDVGKAVNEAYGGSSGSGSSSSLILRSGSYYTVAYGAELRMDLSLEGQTVYLYGNGNYAANGIAVVAGNMLVLEFTDGNIAGKRDSFTITSGDSFIGNADGLRWNRR